MPASAKYHAPLLVLLNHRSSTGVHGPLATAMGLPGMGVHTWDPSTQKPEREREEDHKSKVNVGYIVSPCPKGGGRQQPPGSWIKIKIGGELLESWGASKSDEEASKAGGLSRGYGRRGCGPQNDSPPKSSPEPHLASNKSRPAGLRLSTAPCNKRVSLNYFWMRDRRPVLAQLFSVTTRITSPPVGRIYRVRQASLIAC